MKTKNEKKYDVVFHDDDNSNSKGFSESYEYCLQYIKSNNGRNESYFPDYVGGIVTIVENETGEVVFETDVVNTKKNKHNF